MSQAEVPLRDEQPRLSSEGSGRWQSKHATGSPNRPSKGHGAGCRGIAKRGVSEPPLPRWSLRGEGEQHPELGQGGRELPAGSFLTQSFTPREGEDGEEASSRASDVAVGAVTPRPASGTPPWHRGGRDPAAERRNYDNQKHSRVDFSLFLLLLGVDLPLRSRVPISGMRAESRRGAAATRNGVQRETSKTAQAAAPQITRS